MDIFAFDFFQRALAGGILIGIMAPLIGIFLVLRRLSMIGDTLAHISIAGVALGALVGIYPLGLGFLFAAIAAFGIEKLRRTYRAYAELSIAIMLSGGVALAAIFFTIGKGMNINVTDYLFGSIITLDMMDLWLVLGVTLVVLLFVIFNFKELFLLTLDEDAAKVNGLPYRTYNMIITILTALTISAAIKIVGALMVSALITIPVAASLMIARSFRSTVLYALLFSEIAVILGLSVAGVWNLAPGGTIVLLLIAILIAIITLKRGVKI